MKYNLINDLNYLLKEKNKIILCFILIMVISYVIFRVTYNLLPEDSISNLLKLVFGTQFYLKEDISDIFTLTMIILNYTMYIYIALSILLKDLANLDNLFSRLSLNKFINEKILASFIFSLIINSIIFLIPLLYNDVNINFYFIIIKKVLVTLVLIIYAHILYMFKNKKIALVLLFIPLILIILFYNLNLFELSFISIILVLLILFLLLMIISSKLKYSDLKE